MASTRLSNLMRDTFIEQVMSGVPVLHPFNIDDVKEKIAKLIEARLPEDIKAFDKKHPGLLMRSKSLYLPESLSTGRRNCYYVNVVNHEACEMVDCSGFELQKRNHDTEVSQRAEMRSQLYSIAYACNTVEKLKLALPELESYMPKANDRHLPVATPTDVVVANLMGAGLKIPKEIST